MTEKDLEAGEGPYDDEFEDGSGSPVPSGQKDADRVRADGDVDPAEDDGETG